MAYIRLVLDGIKILWEKRRAEIHRPIMHVYVLMTIKLCLLIMYGDMVSPFA